MGVRKGIFVASGRYRHDSLPDLESPSRDAQICRRVLCHPDLGGFEEVDVLLNADKRDIENQLYDFLTAAERQDFLFIYFSCHGRRDVNGHLYLTAIDTEPTRLPPTAIHADRVREWLDDCVAARIVCVLDCCYAGAFGGEPRQRSNRERVVILTAAASELAHESRGQLTNTGPSPFAEAFFGGIESGQADYDYNGSITVREAFIYAVRRMQELQIPQSPQMRAGTVGDIEFAQAPISPGQLTSDLRSLVYNEISSARLVAVEELRGWLSLGDKTKVKTAEETLAVLLKDRDETVAKRATHALTNRGGQPVSTTSLSPIVAASSDPNWFKRAVFYEVRVRSFFDANNDGIGDLEGLAQRLEYVASLGATCLILAPIFDSPLQDGGFDISDYRTIHSDYGTLSDLEYLISEAHRRELRVVLDMVLNHTSKTHQWFQESRKAPNGPFGDFYVWQDSDHMYADAASKASTGEGNWTYDSERKQYYWHRFYRFEPDLNFDSPAVQDAMSEVLAYWLDKGIDGFRLLTAPYLYEEDGTASEGLDETHAYLARLRSEVDSSWDDRILMASPDSWPSDAASYFGTPDRPECNVVLFTSLISRMFLAMRREDAEPIASLLRSAGDLADDCQWGLFLRNGDELSLDLVSGSDREYLLREYAPNSRMRTARGIRRRLAPLLDGDKSQLELCMALLFSLPGAPVLYYGDEIGMGENLTLPGREALRTPMQWSSQRSGGFSSVEQEDLASPVLLDSAYGYHAVNVESQRRSSRSLLRLVRSLTEIRAGSQSLTSGSYSEIESSSPAVFAYVRSVSTEAVLCVFNFSHYPVAAELDLAKYEGRHPSEMAGRAPFPTVGTSPYVLTLPGHGFYWLNLAADR